MKLTTKLILSMAAFAIPSMASATPAGVSIAPNPSINGTGCPVDNTNIRLNPQGDSMYISFDNLTAEAGPGVNRRDGRKFCQMIVNLENHEGWSYAVKYIQGRGFAHVDANSDVKQIIETKFQSGETQKHEQAIVGPATESIRTRIVIADEELDFSPCDTQRSFQLKLDLRAKASGDNSAFIAYEQGFAEFLKVGLVWKPCSN